MMDDRNPHAPPVTLPDAPAVDEVKTSEPGAAEPNTAVMKFKSCRWRCDPEAGEYCTHRDVLPFAGKEGFVCESWCPDCAFYKLRRSPKKREYNSY
jgi:hypothetical protein